MGKGDRPEHNAPPEIFYNEGEARKYTTNTRMMAIQEKLTQRALELLALAPDGTPKLLLDIGCGSGLSGEALSDAGHNWIGMDISEAMLDVAVEREVDGDVLLSDMGQGLPLCPGVFDGAISISAVQWLCNADKSSHEPRKRLKAFFESLYRCLCRGARAVLQVYPENPAQAEMIVAAAMKVGFSGGLVVDYPHSTRAKKFYLVLMVGPSSYAPQAKMGEESDSDVDMDVETGEVRVEGRQRKRHGKQKQSGSNAQLKTKGWILKKKAQMRKKGYTSIPLDSKYTGRKRKQKRS